MSTDQQECCGGHATSNDQVVITDAERIERNRRVLCSLEKTIRCVIGMHLRLANIHKCTGCDDIECEFRFSEAYCKMLCEGKERCLIMQDVLYLMKMVHTDVNESALQKECVIQDLYKFVRTIGFHLIPRLRQAVCCTNALNS